MQYKIEYTLHKGDKDVSNSRFYHALSSTTAKEMFKATCDAGSLTGEDVELKAVYKRTEGSWQKVKS